ncbi:MAG TPA: alpha/beta fold hydrolase [Candidatus Thermoplasmatota archaeon]|nr:alpha/beta fold hydrolase [Candidatus Thermoplasmatota archaeon]
MVALGSRRFVRVSAGAFAALLVLASLATVAVSYEAADRVVHPPRELRAVTPAYRGLEYERVGFDTADGVPLVGWWMPAADPIGTVVFLHGYTASKSQALAVAPFLVREGYSVLAFDFRAHGESGGTFTSLGVLEALDVRAALDHLEGRGVDMTRVALFGWSMGAAAALHAMPLAPEVRAVVADSSFARLTNVVSHELTSMTGLPTFPFVPLIVHFASRMTAQSPDANEPARFAETMHRPLLVIQGSNDRLARPAADGEVLARAAGAYADLWLVQGAGHVDARRAAPSEYEARVLSFLREAMP